MKFPKIIFIFISRFSIVETALTNANFAEPNHLDEICKEFGEVACFALQLIANVCTQTERAKMAAEANKRALELNPFLWQSFADLCNRGENPNPKQIFQFTNTDIFGTCQGHNLNSVVAFGGGSGGGIGGGDSDTLNTSYVQTPGIDHSFSSNTITPNNHTSIVRGGGMGTTGLVIDDTPVYCNNTSDISNIDSCGQTPFRKQFKYLSTISPSTPSFGILPITSPSETFYSPTLQQHQAAVQQQQMLVEANDQKANKKQKGHVQGSVINRKDTPLQMSKPIFSQTGNITPRAPNTNQLGGQNVRRSSRLSFSNYSVKENNKSANINKFAAPRSPPRKTKQRISKMNLTNIALNEINEKQQQKIEKEKIETITSSASIDHTKVLLNNNINAAQTLAQQVLQMRKNSAEGLMTLLRELAEGYLQLQQYNCAEAIEIFSNIPQHHYFSSWVQSMLARAHYEQHNYEAAAKIFQDIHKKEPHRLHLMEIYSTVLWHLHRDVALSALAQDLLAQDKKSPITWCVSGNCFSLHKEHETAIKFFERAVQVDPDYAYSYTLLGHELVITEELEKAMSCFRTALLKDNRHYNAWFGIGTIYSKQERYNMAEIHFRQAWRINPKNSVIMVHIGAMLFQLKHIDKALQMLNLAIELDPKNPLCKFHRGSLYFQMGKHKEALIELEELKQILPKESVVYYLIGKIHKKMGNVDSALMHFSWATDLDPKGANNQIKDAFDSNVSQSGAGGSCDSVMTAGPSGTPNAAGGVDDAGSTVGIDGEHTSERSDDSTQLRAVEDEELGGPDYDSDSY